MRAAGRTAIDNMKIIASFTGECNPMEGEHLVKAPEGRVWTLADVEALLERYYPCDGYAVADDHPQKAFLDAMHQNCLEMRPRHIHLGTTPNALCWKSLGSESANGAFADELKASCADEVLMDDGGVKKCEVIEDVVGEFAGRSWWTAIGVALGTWAVFGPGMSLWRWMASVPRKVVGMAAVKIWPMALIAAIAGGLFAFGGEAEASARTLLRPSPGTGEGPSAPAVVAQGMFIAVRKTQDVLFDAAGKLLCGLLGGCDELQ